MAIFVPLTLALSLILLQPVKGVVVALQWHMGMHGFAPAHQTRVDRQALVQRVMVLPANPS